jgi:hypothetical protein
MEFRQNKIAPRRVGLAQRTGDLEYGDDHMQDLRRTDQYVGDRLSDVWHKNKKADTLFNG